MINFLSKNKQIIIFLLTKDFHKESHAHDPEYHTSFLFISLKYFIVLKIKR